MGTTRGYTRARVSRGGGGGGRHPSTLHTTAWRAASQAAGGVTQGGPATNAGPRAPCRKAPPPRPWPCLPAPSWAARPPPPCPPGFARNGGPAARAQLSSSRRPPCRTRLGRTWGHAPEHRAGDRRNGGAYQHARVCLVLVTSAATCGRGSGEWARGGGPGRRGGEGEGGRGDRQTGTRWRARGRPPGRSCCFLLTPQRPGGKRAPAAKLQGLWTLSLGIESRFPT